MADKAEIIKNMFCLAEILIKFCYRSCDPPVAPFDQRTCRKVTLEVGEEGVPLLFLLCSQKGAQEKIEFVRFHLLCRIGQKFTGNIASLCQILQLPAEARLGSTRQISVGNDLRVQLMKLVDRGLLAQRNAGHRHVFRERHAEHGIEQVCLSLSVTSGKHHASGTSRLAHGLQPVLHPAEHCRPRLRKILADRAGRHSAAQRFNHMTRIEVSLPMLASRLLLYHLQPSSFRRLSCYRQFLPL